MSENRDLTRLSRPDTALIDSAYGEALALVAEARHYLCANTAVGVVDGSDSERQGIARATSQLTVRLLEMVAWLAACKAECAGEYASSGDGIEVFRVASWDDGWAEPLQKAGQLPSVLGDLVARARDLHRRVRRLGA